MSRIPASEDVFTAIADPTRRAILERLREGERSVGELVEAFPVTQSAVSQHLRVLRDAGLVADTPAGRRRIYRLTPEPLGAVSDWIHHFERFWPERLARLGELLEKHRA